MLKSFSAGAKVAQSTELFHRLQVKFVEKCKGTGSKVILLFKGMSWNNLPHSLENIVHADLRYDEICQMNFDGQGHGTVAEKNGKRDREIFMK